MRAGQLRKRIVVEQVTETLNAQGEPLPSWGAFATVWAAIAPLAGRELYAAQQRAAQVTHLVIMRYLPGLTPKMRVNFGGRVFDILDVLNLEERDREMHVLCKERL